MGKFLALRSMPHFGICVREATASGLSARGNKRQLVVSSSKLVQAVREETI